jgi:hypothetical protein
MPTISLATRRVAFAVFATALLLAVALLTAAAPGHHLLGAQSWNKHSSPQAAQSWNKPTHVLAAQSWNTRGAQSWN